MTTETESLPETLTRSTIELRQLDNHGIPVDFASGCLVENAGSRFVLTVTPPRRQAGNWHIPMYHSYCIATVCHVIRAMNTTSLTDFSNGASAIKEFGFAQLPGDCHPLIPHFDEHQNLAYSPVHVLSVDATMHPSPQMEYGFFCQSNFQAVDENYLHCDELIITGLVFTGCINNYYTFNIPRDLRQQDLLLSASGAPILDVTGKLVALVAGYLVEEQLLLGVPLQNFGAMPFAKSGSH